MSWLKSKMRAAANMVAQAAEAVAPSLSLTMSLYKTPVEEFHHRWTTVSLFMDALIAEELTEAQQRAKLGDSNTRDNLAKLVKLLYAEEDALDRQVHDLDASIDSRPCMEYMLEHNVLQNLCSKAAHDSPSGLMVLVLIFLTDLLRESKINYPILPTRGVYRSVCELIQSAMVREVEDDMVQKCLLHCLHALWVKLKGDPVQTEFFFLRIYKSVTPGDPTNLALSPSKISELVLFTGLLPHMYRDGKLGHKCREALVIAAGLHEPGLSRFILHMTPFCNYAVTGVIQAFDLLPKTIGTKNEKTFRSVDPDAIVLELETLALRLRFCCTLAMVGVFEVDATTCVTKDILTQFHTRFLQGPLLDALQDTSEAAARTAVHYTVTILDMLVRCGAAPDANPLLHLTLTFLLHHHHKKANAAVLPVVTDALELQPTPAAAPRLRLLSELLHRMNSLSASLSVATIQLFAALLALHTPVVDAVLLPPPSPSIAAVHLPWFAARFPHSALAALTADASLWQAIKTHQPTTALATYADTDLMPSILSMLAYVASAEQRLLCGLEIGSTTSTELDTDDDEGDALPSTPTAAWHVRMASVSTVPALPLETAESLAPLFASILLNRLERWLDNSVEENVALSGLVTLLADRAPTLVFDWPVDHGASPPSSKSVRSVLEEVHADAQKRIQRLPQGWSKLADVQTKLMDGDGSADDGGLVESHELLLGGWIVLEEMLKELVAGCIAADTVQTLPVKPEGFYLKPVEDDDDEDGDDGTMLDDEHVHKGGDKTDTVDPLDSLLDVAASQLQSIMSPETTVVP
ncbi:Aste57867_573 [Aphanomyces stellatus]|uniref:Aste57867_573 protein n=1 Tax=Aphanomyces stellatus TaxID=120398 RepID=A0A485K2Y3_9STRA|nr:hypothetical protein As57867_000572 [Aphanomyces stellatus]VFT77798.1 Aste57867_573 [Aphanomyces stellatus]